MSTADEPSEERAIGERISALRTSHRPKLTQHGLAEKAGLSVDTVAKLEQGRRDSARIDSLRKIARALGVKLRDLVSDPDEPAVENAIRHPEPRPAADEWVGLLAGPRRNGRPADADYVASVRDTSQRLVALETLYGGDDALPLALRAFRAAHSTLAAGAFDASVERDLEAAAGEAGEVAAWIAFDAERQEVSRALIHEALLLSRSAGDRDMELFELTHMSMQSLHLRRPREGLRLAEDVLGDGRLAPRVGALFHLRRSRALAQYGDRPRALAAIDAAEGIVSSSIAASDPPWTWWLDDAELRWHRAMVFSELSRHSEAAADFARSVELTSNDQGRGAYLGRVYLLDALTRVGAWRDAEPLLPDVAGRAAEVRSARASRLLRDITHRIISNKHAGSILTDRAVDLRRSLASD